MGETILCSRSRGDQSPHYAGSRLKPAWMRFICLIAILWGTMFGLTANAQQAETFSVASRLVENGSVGEGIALYESLVEQGVADEVLFYNLGNAYYEQNALGEAIVNYQRALRIDPADGDARHNLAVAREQVQAIGQDGDDVIGSFFFRFTRDQMAWAALGSAVLLSLLYALYRVAVQKLLLGVIVVAMCAGFIMAIFLTTAYRDVNRPSAVVVETAALYVDASAESRAIFSLPDGTEVVIRDEDGAWINVSIVNNDIAGWMLVEHIKRVKK